MAIQYSSAVREMPEDDRPRERLARLGPEALRDAELLAVIFRTGTRDLGAVALAESLIKEFSDIRGLFRASLEELQHVSGIGRVKAIETKAALELGRRLRLHESPQRVRIQCAKDVADYLLPDFREYDTEHFVTLLLNTKNEVLKKHLVSQGGLDAALAAPREVFHRAVRERAASVIVVHNHPSGDPEPSRADVELTKTLVKAGEILQIPLLDHIVLGDGRFVSLKERQLM